MAKSTCMAYFLWLIGGVCGLHHFYLGRDIQAFLWWALPGGYFGAGWFRDIWRIPEYVKDANDDIEFIKTLTEKMKKYQRPPFSLPRTFGQFIIGNLFGILLSLSIPGKDETGINLRYLQLALSPLGSAFGVWLVGNIGREKGSFKWPLLGSYLGIPICFALGLNTSALSTLLAVILFQWKSKKWRRQIREPASTCKRLTVLSICAVLYITLWTSYLYFNLKITTKEGDEVKFRDAIIHFLRSPMIQEFAKSINNLLEEAKAKGFYAAWAEFILSLDPLGEKNALKVMSLPTNATQSDIKSRYRELSKKYHPDRVKGDLEEKEEAQKKFVEVQAAYEVLSDIKLKRTRKNKKSETESERTEF